MEANMVNWVLDHWETIALIVSFAVYYKLNKRQKRAEVKETEGSALSTMQTVYDKFAKDWEYKYDEVKEEVDRLKKSDERKTFIINGLSRRAKGLTREVGQLKKSLSETEKFLSEVEGIACIKLGCKDRDPAIGNYKHKKEA